VTDQGSLSITCSAISACGAVEPAAAELAQAYVVTRRPLWPQSQPGVHLRCRVCGRIGRFIDPFPRIPRRR
jgi:hypothetical protein